VSRHAGQPGVRRGRQRPDAPGVPTLLADDWGAGAGAVPPRTRSRTRRSSPAGVRRRRPARRLVAARALVAAKLRNHAALSDRFPRARAAPTWAPPARARYPLHRRGHGRGHGPQAPAAQWYGSFAAPPPAPVPASRGASDATRWHPAQRRADHPPPTADERCGQPAWLRSGSFTGRAQPCGARLRCAGPFRHPVDRVVLELAPRSTCGPSRDGTTCARPGWSTSRELVGSTHLACPASGWAGPNGPSCVRTVLRAPSSTMSPRRSSPTQASSSPPTTSPTTDAARVAVLLRQQVRVGLRLWLEPDQHDGLRRRSGRSGWATSSTCSRRLACYPAPGSLAAGAARMGAGGGGVGPPAAGDSAGPACNWTLRTYRPVAPGCSSSYI
jgi:hypothetical protein